MNKYQVHRKEMDEMRRDSVVHVCNSNFDIWDSGCIIVGLGMVDYDEESCGVIFKLEDKTISLNKVDLQGFIQALQGLLPQLDEANKKEVAFKKSLKEDDEI